VLVEGGVLALIVAKVIEHVSEQVVDGGESAFAEQVRSWLGRDPQRLALSTALVRTEARFATAYPDWHAELFDAAFLSGRAAPLLARALTRTGSVSAAELAQAWAQDIGGETGQRYSAQVEAAAAELLAWWEQELGRFAVFRAALDSRALERSPMRASRAHSACSSFVTTFVRRWVNSTAFWSAPARLRSKT
jgi:hypothetical protein